MNLDALQRSMESGEPLRVRYFGGSSPGAERTVQPLSVKDGKVRAVDLATREAKSYLLEKMELADDPAAAALAAALPPPPISCATLDEFAAIHGVALQGLGWAVLHESDSISLHRSFKNGRPMKSAEVTLSFRPVTYDPVIDWDAPGTEVEVQEVPRDNPRPWSFSAGGQASRSYKDFAHAQQQFLEAATALAPTKRPQP